MAAEPNAVEQAVSRTLRDNLEKIQRTADELHQAVNDMVAACASSRASNALPSMMRAQTSAASLAATLEVLSRFVTSALQPAMRMPFEPDILRAPSMSAPPVARIRAATSPASASNRRDRVGSASAGCAGAGRFGNSTAAFEAPAVSGNSPAVEMATWLSLLRLWSRYS